MTRLLQLTLLASACILAGSWTLHGDERQASPPAAADLPQRFMDLERQLEQLEQRVAELEQQRPAQPHMQLPVEWCGTQLTPRWFRGGRADDRFDADILLLEHGTITPDVIDAD